MLTFLRFPPRPAACLALAALLFQPNPSPARADQVLRVPTPAERRTQIVTLKKIEIEQMFETARSEAAAARR
ncbi:MAG TPA: hypothetical protein VFK69_05360, partial [Candidatus Eisenbacteria bacterium]|nr:hypothetical protein [Candidatus Eisenbacteria bacterium]